MQIEIGRVARSMLSRRARRGGRDALDRTSTAQFDARRRRHRCGSDFHVRRDGGHCLARGHRTSATPDDIVEKHLAAIGGRGAEKMASRTRLEPSQYQRQASDLCGTIEV